MKIPLSPALLATWVLLLPACRAEDTKPAPTPPTVVVALPLERAVTDYYHYTGTAAATETVEIRARVLGEIREMTYTPATLVEAGASLFKIEPEPYEIAVDAAEADVERADAALQVARLTQQRVAAAFGRGAATDLEQLEATAIVRQREAEKRAAEAKLRDAKRELAYTTVRTPITGRVSRAFVDVGNLVGVGEPTLLTQVTRMDPIWVYLDVSERIVLEYLGRGRNGEVGSEPERPPIEVALANTPTDVYPYKGVINWVDNEVDEATGTIRVRAELPNTSNQLFPGLFVRARVPREVLPNALLVPENAIVRGLDGVSLLVVDDQNVVERRSVTLGPREGALRVILEGIDVDDRVVVAGTQKARPGAPVTPTTAEASRPGDGASQG